MIGKLLETCKNDRRQTLPNAPDGGLIYRYDVNTAGALLRSK